MRNNSVGAMEDIEEFMRVCDLLIKHMTDEECEEIVCILYFVRQKTAPLYGELDELAASVAFAKLPSID
jgi:hypothetical protein